MLQRLSSGSPIAGRFKHGGGSTQAGKANPEGLGFISVGILKRIFRQVGTIPLARARSMTLL
jgi:hypothetical protein